MHPRHFRTNYGSRWERTPQDDRWQMLKLAPFATVVIGLLAGWEYFLVCSAVPFIGWLCYGCPGLKKFIRFLNKVLPVLLFTLPFLLVLLSQVCEWLN